jgi:hypothetical protein
MSLLGQNAKYSARVDGFRFASELGHCWTRFPLRICADAVEKVFLNHRAQILKAAGASIRKFLGGSHHQMVNLSMTSAAELRSHRIAIAACFAFWREINSSALWDFFDSICQERKSRRNSITTSTLLAESRTLTINFHLIECGEDDRRCLP